MIGLHIQAPSHMMSLPYFFILVSAFVGIRPNSLLLSKLCCFGNFFFLLWQIYNMASDEQEAGPSFIIPDEPDPKPASLVWDYFSLAPGEKRVSGRFVTCKICNSILSRGTAKQYSFGTSSLWKHLRTMHPRNFAAIHQRRDQPTSATGVSAPTVVDPAATTSSNVSSGVFSSDDQSDIFGLLRAHCVKCNCPMAVGQTTYSGFTDAVRNHRC